MPYAHPEPSIEDHNPAEGRGIPKPAQINKDLGKNAIISCIIKNIYLKKPVKEHFANSYGATSRKNFRVLKLQRTRIEGKPNVVVVVEFLNNEGPPKPGDGTKREYCVSYGSLKLVTTGAPNQLFYPQDTLSRAPN